jgi:ABC-type cobalamin/Fe3+-siderophores transport system ATPase subunit
MLNTSKVRVSYDGLAVLHDISFEIREPSVVAILGPNGSGKTTLLRALSGLVKYVGSVRISGSEVAELKPWERPKYVTYVPPTISIMADLTIGDLITIGNERADLSKIDYLAGLLGIKELLNRKVWEVSSGEFERSLIVRGLSRDSLIYALDEPLSHTDLKYQLIVLKLAMKIKRQGKIILIASNQLSPLINFADYILMLKNGKVVRYGTVRDVVSEDLFAEVYGVKAKVLKDENIFDVVPYDITGD